MTSLAPTVLPPSSGSQLRGLLALAILPVLAVGSLRAQSVLAPLPASEFTAPALREPPDASDPRSALTPPPTPFRSGEFALQPHLLTRYLYGDGIQPRPGVDATTSVFSVAPGLTADLGRHWVADYSPVWTTYSNQAFRDTADQSFRLNGATEYEGWRLRLDQSYTMASPPLVETGGQSKQTIYLGSFGVLYQLGGNMLLDTSLDYNHRATESLPTSREWSGSAGVKYQFPSRLQAGVELTVGRVNMSQGSNMNYTRPQVDLAYQPTRKLTLKLVGGMEHRNFTQTGASSLDNFIVSASLELRPVDGTRVAFQAGRDVTASYFANQVSENTRWLAELEQRLFRNYLLTVDLGHYNTRYVSSGGAAAREDSTLSWNLRLSTAFLRRGQFSVVYLHGRNGSDIAGYGFTSNQVGFEIGFRY